MNTKDYTTIFVKYQDTQSFWRWRLVALNGRNIADSGEGYRNESDCDHGISLVKDAFRSPIIKK